MDLFRTLGFLFIASFASVALAEVTRPAAATQPAKGAAQATFEEARYDNGQFKSRYATNPAGLRWGPYNLYSEDGKRTERGTYKNGELDGARQTFYPNGRVKLQENYRKGQLDGPVAEFDEKGTSVRTAEFKAGIVQSDRTVIDGLLVYPRSAAMIQNELARIGKLKIETVAPSVPIPPHAGGNDSQEDRENAVRRLMGYRYLCYTPYEGMALDPVYCAHDEAACGILAEVGKLTHTPDNPGWPVDRFKYAYEGTSSSNLYGGNGCVSSVDAYMNDSDGSNVDRIGHRRWSLNPAMGKVGFASHKGYSAMWSFDSSRRQVPDFDFIAFPAAGLFPSTHFHPDYAWNISLNPNKYAPANEKNLTISITPVHVQTAENKLAAAAKPLELNYTKVDLQGFGIPNCIIFRPAGLSTEPGSAYLLEVTGLKTKDGKQTVIRYMVEFFKPTPVEAHPK